MKTTKITIQKKIYKFNKTYVVGDKVRIRFTPSVIETCTVKSPATILGGDKCVVYLKELKEPCPIENVIY
jgi:ribosomal protein L21E